MYLFSCMHKSYYHHLQSHDMLSSNAKKPFFCVRISTLRNMTRFYSWWSLLCLFSYLSKLKLEQKKKESSFLRTCFDRNGTCDQLAETNCSEVQRSVSLDTEETE